MNPPREPDAIGGAPAATPPAWPRRALALVTCAACCVPFGCAYVGSGVRRTGAVAAGTAVGAGAGYGLNDHSPAATAIGAIAGGALTHLALGPDPDVQQAGFDAGYVQGQSDAIKRQYFLRHALEAQPPAGATDAGETVYYVMPGPEVTADGRKLEPHQVAVRIVE